MNTFALLKNPIQEYEWGSTTFIQELLRESAPLKGKPLAEIWMGSHPHGCSQVLWKGRWTLLSHLIEESPESVLGCSVARRFSGKLPFLFKVLAAAKPLSIQAHPNLKQAAEGFQKEEIQGIGLDDPKRNYRDQNHKPEIFCALNPSWILKGFRNPEEILSLMETLGLSSIMESISPILRGAVGKNIEAFFTAVIGLDQKRQRMLVSEAVRAIRKGSFPDPAFSWVIELNRLFPDEVMALSPLFLNLIQLKPGDATLIRPGTLHAYLEGAGVELMANSDNVIRAGLTAKKRDSTELLRILNFHHQEANILKGEVRENAERAYPCEVEEFALSMISVDEHTPYMSSRVRSVEMMICVKGKGRITDLRSGDILTFSQGVSFVVPAKLEQYSIKGTAAIYKAAVPLGRCHGASP